METEILSKNALKLVVMCALPAIVVFGVGFLFWPASYVVVPVFFPFSPYSMNTGNWAQTIFHTDKYGWYFFAGYSVLIAAVTVWISRARTWPVSLAMYLGVVAVAAIVVHVLLRILGFQYYMDSP